MTKRVLYLLLGTVLTSLGIVAVLHCGLGAFSITLANKAIAKWCGFDLAIANLITEGAMLAYATYKGEGVGLTAISSLTLGSITISLFDKILPYSPWMAILFFVAIIGWALQGKACFGHGASNILTEALMKTTGRSLVLIRTIIDVVFLIIAFIGYPYMITWLTILVTFGTAPAMKYIYKLFRYEPVDIQHSYLIKGKSSHGHL